MLSTYGMRIYKSNTPEEKKCDCDRIADWIASTDYINLGYVLETAVLIIVRVTRNKEELL